MKRQLNEDEKTLCYKRIKSMKEELFKELLRMIKSMSNFTIEQAPDAARQILEYGVWDAQFSIMIWVIPAVIALLFAIWLVVWMIKEVEIDPAPLVFILVAISIVLFCVAGANYKDIKQIEIAPKVYLIDYISDRLK